MADIVTRIENRMHDAPMPTEHLLDEAAEEIVKLRNDKHIASLAESVERIAKALESIDSTLGRVTGKMSNVYGGAYFVRTSDIGD